MLRNIARRSLQCASRAVQSNITSKAFSLGATKQLLFFNRLSQIGSRSTAGYLLQQRSITTSFICRNEEARNEGRKYTTAELNTERYHRLSNEVLEHITSKLEELMDESDIEGYDVEYTQGVMTIRLGEHGTYVINKQPPNHQIWTSSPISGPLRFDYDEQHQKWFYHRDYITLDELLNAELSKVFGRKVDLLEGFEYEDE